MRSKTKVQKPQNTQSLQYTLWWYLMTKAGMRASREHLFLCWGDVKLKTTTDGKRYITHMERQTKMRMGEGAATKQMASKIFENAMIHPDVPGRPGLPEV